MLYVAQKEDRPGSYEAPRLVPQTLGNVFRVTKAKRMHDNSENFSRIGIQNTSYTCTALEEKVLPKYSALGIFFGMVQFYTYFRYEESVSSKTN